MLSTCLVYTYTGPSGDDSRFTRPCMAFSGVKTLVPCIINEEYTKEEVSGHLCTNMLYITTPEQ